MARAKITKWESCEAGVECSKVELKAVPSKCHLSGKDTKDCRSSATNHATGKISIGHCHADFPGQGGREWK